MSKDKLIVLDSPDGSGKSTLGEMLSTVLNVELMHDGGPSENREHAQERMEAFLQDKNKIRDRSTIFSDPVYKAALGNEPLFTQDELDEYVVRAAEKGILLIYCRPSLDVLMRNTEFLARAKAHKPPEYAQQVMQRLPAIVENYDKSIIRWASLGLSVINYDYTSAKTDEFCEIIRESYWTRP